MRTRRRLLLTSLSLAGLYGCGAGEPVTAADPVIPRNVSVWDPPLESCLTKTTLTLNHADSTTDVATSISEGLAQYARPGDLVELQFAVMPGCLADHGPRVTLASYTTAGITMDSLAPVQPPQAYDVHTARFEAGSGALAVRLPDCFFRVELAFGEPLATLTWPHGDYEGEKRRIAATQGGHASCEDVPRLAIERFDTVEKGWGEAPLVTHFGWELDVGKDVPELTCELDFEGDGTIDHAWSPCPATTSALKVAALPMHTFHDLGEHRPELVVSDGTRRLWAGTEVLANHLDYKSDVRFPEQSANFVSAKLTPAQAPTLSELILKYASMKGIPAVAVGDVVVGSGYMLRVVKRFQNGSTVTIYGHPVGLDETIAGGFFGVRDVQVSTANAHCASGKCIGTITPVAAPPGGPTIAGKSLALDAATESFGDEEDKFGIKITVPLSEDPNGPSASEAELFAGIVVKKFAVSGLLDGPLRVDVDVAPTIEVAVAVMVAVENQFELGDIIIGGLPTPIPVSLHLMPRIDLAAAFKFTGKFTAAAPFQLRHDEHGWQHRFAPQISGDADLLETAPGSEYAAEAKITIVDELGFALGFLYGPYVAPSAGLGIKATLNPGDCKFCMAVFGELGGEFGWEAPWGLGNILEPVSVGFVEHEFKKRCEEILDGCDPGEPPGDPGGTWGDVHVVSHDGLLFDFQAGGEFVLVRSTVAGDDFEIQARQEPLGADRSLSFNTAVATVVDGQRVGFYVDMPQSQLFVGDTPRTLADEQTTKIGGGALTRAGDLYTLEYPGGDVLRVRVGGDHLDLDVALAPGRAGQVEGVLGDADGDRDNDIGLGGGEFLPQPVGFDALYRGDDSFTAAWRVAFADTLFDYAEPDGWQAYRAPKYMQMPISTPSPNPEHIDDALTACADCPDALRDTCMLDVAFTGDVAYAAACEQVAATPGEVMYPADDYVCVAPRYGAPIDCADERVVFRGPGLADADQWPTGKDLTVWVQGGFNDQSSWSGVERFKTTEAPAGGAADWGDKFTCEPLGDGDWGECTLRLDPVDSPCNGFGFPLFRFIVQEDADEPALHDMGYFTRPPSP